MEHLKQTMTREQYRQFVEEHERTPTQDPIYNHAAGSPDWRPSVLQEGASGARRHDLVGDKPVPHISEATDEVRARIFDKES